MMCPAVHISFNMKILLSILFLSLAGCATPFSLSAGGFGFNAVANFPNGIQVPVKVVPSAAVIAPVMQVPPDSLAARETTAVIQGNGKTTTVPVVIAPVEKETLAVPF